jgi:hypothetical protein
MISRFNLPNATFKLLAIAEQNYRVVLARGTIGRESVAVIFRKIFDLAASVPECRVLIDLEDAVLNFAPADLDLLSG